MAVEERLAARRVRNAQRLLRPGDHELAQVGKGRDPVVGPRLRILPAHKRPAGRLETVVVRPVDGANEGRRNLPLTRRDNDGWGLDRHRGATVVLQRELRDPFAVDGEVDVLEARALPEEGADGEDVVAVRRKVVRDDHAAARAVGGALDVIPSVLGDLDGVGVLDRPGGRAGVADREAADFGCSPEVGFQKRGREPLGVGHVVECAQVGVGGKPAARVDVEGEQVADDALVFGPVESLEPAEAGVGVACGRIVDHHLQRLHERSQRVAAGSALAGRGHHPGPQLADHLLGGGRALVRAGNVEAVEAQVAAQPALVVAAGAVALDNVVESGIRGDRIGWAQGLGGV